MSVSLLAPEVRQQRIEAFSRPAALNARDSAEVANDSRAYVIAKRTLDVGVSATALLLASPVMLLIALGIKLESPGPVFFGHVRLAKGGKRFRCLKFRSMRQGAHDVLTTDPRLRRLYEDNDYKIPLERDPRLTRFGLFLRKSSLDELPQLINVLGGTMSLVGPRPIVPEELHWYREQEASRFLSVKPGITGPWQVMGRSRIGYPERKGVELTGISKRSFWEDIKILARSVPAVITARGSM